LIRAAAPLSLQEAEAAMKAFELAIEGMHCDGCVRRVTAALAKVAGCTVEKVDVGTARVRAQDDDAAARAVAALYGIGFRASLASSEKGELA
jgi:copper chaperone CopZ